VKKDSGSCHQNENNFTESLYAVTLDGSYKKTCCNSNLCNSLDFFEKKFNDCEFNKKLISKMKLVYPIRDLTKSTVTKCYYCSGCSMNKKPIIIDCKKKYKNIESFACQVSTIKDVHMYS
jgi:hypothetical protein